MSEEKNQDDGVVSIVWKDIPGYSRYQASNTGLIRRKEWNGYTVVKMFESKTSRGSYLVSSVTNDAGANKPISSHKLIALAFFGEPPKPEKGRMDVNHKDGDKHNNHIDNLEWVPHAENCVHAIKTGLRADNIVIKAASVKDGRVLAFHSLAEMSREWKIPRNDLRTLLAKHRKIPYLGEWLLEADEATFNRVVRQDYIKVKAKDHVTGEIIISNNVSHMQVLTGVNSSTIKKYLKHFDKHFTKETIGGYSFKYLTDESDWSVVPVNEAKQARERYEQKVNAPKIRTFVIKNYFTGSIEICGSIGIVANKLDTSTGSVGEHVRLNRARPVLRMLRGYIVQDAAELRPWPNYTPIEAEQTRQNTKLRFAEIEVTDTLLNTTKRYSTGAEFAKEIGVSTNHIRVKIRRSIKHNQPYIDRFLFKYVE